jgi:hypothetical protein
MRIGNRREEVMRRHTGAVIALLAVCGTAAVAAMQTKTLHTSRVDAPPLLYGSFPELCAASDMVVVGTAGASTTRRVAGLPGLPDDARLIVTVSVDDLIRQSLKQPVVSGTFEVELMAGRHDLGTSIREFKGHGLNGFEKGQRYLFFLKWSAYSSAFYLTTGPSSVYGVHGESLEPLSSEAAAKKLAARRTSELLPALHASPDCAR